MNTSRRHRSVMVRTFYFFLLTVLISSGLTVGPASASSTADAWIRWTGIVLNTNGGFSQSITPLWNDPTLIWHTFIGSSCLDGAHSTLTLTDSCFDVGFGGDGTVYFRDKRGNATDVKAFPNSTCKTYANNEFKDSFGSSAICFISLKIEQEKKYVITVQPYSWTAGNWWLASIRIGDSGDTIPIGAIRHDSLATPTLFQNQIDTVDSSGQVNYDDCNLVPRGSAIFGKPINNVNLATTQYVSTGALCAVSSIANSDDSSQSVLLNFGGASATRSNSTPTATPIPTHTAKPTPKKPTKLKAPVAMNTKTASYKFAGGYLYFSIQLPTSATRAFLVSPAAISSYDNPLEANVSNHVANFVVKIDSGAYGLPSNLLLYSTNAGGKSPDLNFTLQVPSWSVQSSPKSTPSAKPEATSGPTVTCNKGDQKRVFVGTACPPGWSSG